ncbi:hypothetical protein HDU79_005597 [Rhizoclosmatium sp. JEL0117]|nr:hypothetical protein HDU79_005597 [Rhizoclosmatium sp. JEL0117]
MSRDLLIPTEIVVCQTIREMDGLAMSSRNRYLSVEERETAPVLYRALRAAEVLFEGGERDANVLREVAGKILKESGVPVEYLSVANSLSLEEEAGKIGKDGAMMSGAVRIGKTRIIDNVLLGVEVRK